MLTAASGTGAAKRPVVHKAVTHAGRPVVHHATLTAAYKGSAPRKAAPKKPRAAGPKFPTLGKLPKPKTGLAVPLPSSSPWKPPQGRVTIPHAPAGPVSPYVNPLRGVHGLVPERIDQGVDYAGTGPIFALGPGKITNVGIGNQTGWGPPNHGIAPGGFVAEQLSSGPGKGHIVYVAEGIYPTVHTGQTVTAKTVIANMVAPIETGYASGSGTQPLAQATGELSGPISTGYGSAYSRLLQRLGAPAGLPQDPGAATRYQSVPASYSVTGGSVPTPSKGHISLPPAVPPTSGVHGVNPPSSVPMVPMGPVELTAHVTPTRRAKGGAIPKFRKPVPTVISVPPVLKPKKKPPAPTPSPSVTTITSSKGTGSALGTGQAAPTSGGMSGGGTLLIVAGVGIVLLLVFMNKKGKKGKGSRPRR